MRSARRRYRTLFLSDIHLGTRACKAEFLLDFLDHVECEQLYLVGDILDGWQMQRSWFWHESHGEVVAEILRRARTGTRVVYVPGNHDEDLRRFDGSSWSGVEIARECVHETADGRRVLVVHGDEHDVICQRAKWIALLGDWGYQASVSVNDSLNRLRRYLGRPYWSLSGYLKRSVKNAVTHVDEYERNLAREARERGLDGVTCGHVHSANVREIDGVTYSNCGDWVDSCTALVEHANGRFEVLDWMQERGVLLHRGVSWEIAATG